MPILEETLERGGPCNLPNALIPNVLTHRFLMGFDRFRWSGRVELIGTNWN